MATKNNVKTSKKSPGPSATGPQCPFGKRLTSVLDFYNIKSFRSLEEEAKLSIGGISRYMKGPVEPTRTTVDKMADTLGCSREILWTYLKGESSEFPLPVKEGSTPATINETAKKNPYYKPEEERGNQGLSRGDSAPGGMVDKQRDDSRPRHPGRVGVVDVDGKHILKIPESCRLYDVMSHGPVLIDSDFRNVITDTAAQVHSGMLCRCEVFRGSHAGTYFGVVTIDEKAGKIGIDDIRIPKLRRMVIVDRDDVSIVKIAGLWFS